MFERRKQQLHGLGNSYLHSLYLGDFADELREALQLPADCGLEDGIPSLRVRIRSEDEDAQQ
jgi:hypothetical protein